MLFNNKASSPETIERRSSVTRLTAKWAWS